MKRVVVGTRGTPLALIQTQEVVDKLRQSRPDVEFDVKIVRTAGDRAAEAPLRSLGVGIFVKEIEDALLRGEIDMAVHSHKDLPPLLAPGLSIAAVTERLDPRDALVNRWNCDLEDLPSGARIGTSSPRRAAQLRRWAPQVEVLPVRGSVGTRIEKAAGNDYDGVVLAAAGMLRLGVAKHISQYLRADRFIPAPGQGALAVEVRSDDHATSWMLRSVDHAPTRRAVMAEMAFLERLGSGCQEPSAAYARVSGETMVMQVFLASTDGEQSFYTKARGRADNPHELAMEAVQQLIERGAGHLVPGARR